MADVNKLGAISLGKVQSWEDKKASSITPISFPGKDSGKTEGVDTLGVIAYINISGRWTGNYATIQGYIAAIKGISDGQQTSAQTLKSPFVNSRDSTDTLRFGTISSNTSVTASKLIDSAALFSTRGVQAGDIVKNLSTGEATTVSGVDSEIQLALADDIFTTAGETFACTATINCKVIDIIVRWSLPGLSFCNYQLSVMQVA